MSPDCTIETAIKALKPDVEIVEIYKKIVSAASLPAP